MPERMPVAKVLMRPDEEASGYSSSDSSSHSSAFAAPADGYRLKLLADFTLKLERLAVQSTIEVCGKAPWTPSRPFRQ